MLPERTPIKQQEQQIPGFNNLREELASYKQQIHNTNETGTSRSVTPNRVAFADRQENLQNITTFHKFNLSNN